MADLERERMKFWILTQRSLIDDIRAENWTPEERNLASSLNDHLFRTVWPAGSNIRSERNRLLLAYKEQCAIPECEEDDF